MMPQIFFINSIIYLFYMIFSINQNYKMIFFTEKNQKILLI